MGTPEDLAPRRPHCCGRAGVGTCPTKTTASARCPSLFNISISGMPIHVLVGNPFLPTCIFCCFHNRASPEQILTDGDSESTEMCFQQNHLQSPRRVDHLRCRVDVIDRQLGRPKVVPGQSCVITIGRCHQTEIVVYLW